MSGYVRTRSKSEGSQDDRDSSKPLEPLVLNLKKFQKKGSSTETHHVTPDQGKKDEGAAVVQVEGKGPNPGDLQELPQPKTEGKDGLDVKEEILPNLEPTKMPEAGEGQPQV